MQNPSILKAEGGSSLHVIGNVQKIIFRGYSITFQAPVLYLSLNYSKSNNKYSNNNCRSCLTRATSLSYRVSSGFLPVLRTTDRIDRGKNGLFMVRNWPDHPGSQATEGSFCTQTIHCSQLTTGFCSVPACITGH